MEAIGFNIPGLISQFINFGIFLVLMSLILYKPVTRMLDQRAERIREALSEAERAREESARSGEEVQQAVAEPGSRPADLPAGDETTAPDGSCWPSCADAEPLPNVREELPRGANYRTRQAGS